MACVSYHHFIPSSTRLQRNFRYHRCLDPPKASSPDLVLQPHTQDEMMEDVDVDKHANHRDGEDRSSSQVCAASWNGYQAEPRLSSVPIIIPKLASCA